ncbi:MAG TPA: hypothetical protein PKD59_08440 [Miltoncostaeaceae bacterium]|nr:hypothetical protein [Miltoncostaeaceae bacterium]
MTTGRDSRDHRTALERGTAAAAFAAAPVIAAVGVVCAIVWPEAVSGEADPTTGGIVAGTVAFVLVTAAPLVLFGWALRSGNPRALTVVAVAAPVWAVWFGLIPLVGALVGGWEGLAPPAVVTAAAAGVLDGFVLVAARRGLRRSRPGGGGTSPDPRTGTSMGGPGPP